MLAEDEKQLNLLQSQRAEIFKLKQQRKNIPVLSNMFISNKKKVLPSTTVHHTVALQSPYDHTSQEGESDTIG